MSHGRIKFEKYVSLMLRNCMLNFIVYFKAFLFSRFFSFIFIVNYTRQMRVQGNVARNRCIVPENLLHNYNFDKIEY